MPKHPLDDTQPLQPTDPQRPPRETRGPGCGCWLGAFFVLLLSVGLATAGAFFLPPFNLYDRFFGVQYTQLSPTANALAVDGLTLVVDPADAGGDFGVALERIAPERTTNSERLTTALAAVPPYLALQGGIYTVQTTGTTPASAALSLTVPEGIETPDLLDVYGWDAARSVWRFLPARLDGAGALTAAVTDLPDVVALFQSAASDQPTVLVAYDVTQTLTPDVGMVASIVAPGGLQPTADGKLTGSLAAGFELSAGYQVMPTLRNFADPRAIDPQTLRAILSDPAVREEHVAQITAFASGGYDGVFIDYRDVPVELRPDFSAFITALGASLDSTGLQLGVVVPAATPNAGVWETGAYDWHVIGQAADYVEIALPLDPSAFAPGSDRLVEAMVRWGVGEVARQKLLLGLSARSLQQVSGAYNPLTYEQALAALGDVEVEANVTQANTIAPGSEIRARLDGYQAVAGVDSAIQAAFVDYVNETGTTVARMWLTTPEALRFRMDRTLPLALGGVAFTDLLAAPLSDGVLQAIQTYRLQIPSPASERELALNWRIESASGVVATVTTGLNEPLVATIDAGEGNYAINVEVVGGEQAVVRGGAAVAVFAPTNTPTPAPTATPTPTPEPTQVAVTAAPQAVAAAPAVNSAGAIVVGNFEYGGHVTNAATGAAGAMQSAGMNWMKVQLKYNAGMSPEVASSIISDAHSRGFKILLGIVGDRNELASGGGGYIAQFADFVGGVAGLGPDAIEVWNEPNLDREWPTGQISGAGYVELLRASYNSIKSRNGGVMVISGAPAPTGAENAFPGQVMNDNRWISEVVAAGGLQYMDCLGAHYNEGIVSPTQRSGDPRDGYYTRYFWGMVDTYWSLIGGQKPICFTELGYLTPEGFPPLPSFFGWAQNVTLSQQAAWLAEAAALSSQSGKVRLMIIWNIDFSVYNSDPQAGYAIIRPGGGCPACSALAAARGG